MTSNQHGLKQFTRIPVSPVAKPRMSRSDKWNSRKCVTKYFDFKDELNLLWKQPVIKDRCEIIFYLPVSASWSKKKKQSMLLKPHQHKPDIDNLIKSFFDAILVDDSYIYEVRASKYWDNEGSILFRNLTLSCDLIGETD